MRILSVFLILAASFLYGHRAWAGLYNLEDLEVLESHKNYREFLDHAHDIRPINRKKRWKDMVLTMAGDYISHLVATQSWDEASWNMVMKISDWPSLREDEFFISHRNEYIIGYAGNCASSTDHSGCLELIKMAWDKTPMKERFPDFSVNLSGKISILWPEDIHWELLAGPIKTPLSQFFCKKDHVQRLLFNRAEKFLRPGRKKMQIRDFLKNNHHENCLASWLPTLKSGLQDRSGVIRQTAWQLLRSRNLLSRKEQDVYLTTFILNGPILGDTFNLAWNALRDMGQNYKRRNPVVDELKKHEPLPDGLFSSADLERKKIVTRQLMENMPEFIEYYGKTCLDYFEGTREFPNGNPTVSCRDFFRIYKDMVKRDDPLLSRLWSIHPSPFKLQQD